MNEKSFLLPFFIIVTMIAFIACGSPGDDDTTPSIYTVNYDVFITTRLND